MAIALAEAGADICLVMREPPPGTQPNMSTADAIRALGRRVEIVHCDLADLDAVKALFDTALDAVGGEIHVLVNCAGIQRRSPAVDFPEQDWDDVSGTPPPPGPHIHSPFIMGRAASPSQTERHNITPLDI